MLPLGSSNGRLTPVDSPTVGRPGRRAISGRHARTYYEQHPNTSATPVPRQRKPAARNRALGYPTPASSDWQRRHRARRPGLPTTTTSPPSGRNQPCPLDKRHDISVVLCRVGALGRFPGISDLQIPLNQANAGFSPSMSCRAKSGRSRRVDKVLTRREWRNSESGSGSQILRR